MQHLIPSKNFSWSTAKKTQTIRAKPLINIMVDSSVMTKFLLDTLTIILPYLDNTIDRAVDVLLKHILNFHVIISVKVG